MSTLHAFWLSLISCCFIFSIQAQNVVSVEFEGERTQAELTAAYGIQFQNGVELWKVTYTTPDVFNQLDTASGLLVLPIRDEMTIYPLLVYQHGTVDGPQDVPSNLQGGYQIAEVFGGLGYVSLAPDYLGAGEARGFHPYVHRASEASAAVDMIRAIRSHAPEMNVSLNDQLFITGYSQGGHASMALHQALELELSDEIELTAAAHLSGPYSVSGVMREVMVGDEPYNYLAYLPNIYLSYNYVYGLYDELEQVFKPAYVAAIQDFYEGTIGLSNLNDFLINSISEEHGAPIARHMLQDSIVAILEDPESGHPILEALKDNDTYEWAPQQPTRIFYCMADDQVHYRNSVFADSVMQALGATDLLTGDLNSSADHGECVEPAVIQTALFFGIFAAWIVDTKDVNQKIPLQLFPNPAQDWLQLEGLTTNAQVQLYNLEGLLVLNKALPLGINHLDLPELPTGVYWLKVSADNGTVVRRVVIE
ncbi:MAG: T9SS type A sorting domain-containing protein [Chitinophagales bacterium]|nr:T9SS type A sorting domain-containing protein [Chitinophagales bacterium]